MLHNCPDTTAEFRLVQILLGSQLITQNSSLPSPLYEQIGGWDTLYDTCIVALKNPAVLVVQTLLDYDIVVLSHH